jgi:hypothetical protein
MFNANNLTTSADPAKGYTFTSFASFRGAVSACQGDKEVSDYYKQNT